MIEIHRAKANHNLPINRNGCPNFPNEEDSLLISAKFNNEVQNNRCLSPSSSENHRSPATMTSSFSDQSSIAATVNSLAVEPPSSPRPPPLHALPKPPSRHVNFSELPPKHRSRARNHFSAAVGSRPDAGENCGPTCLAFCAWSCLAVFAFFLFVLLLFVLFAALLHAGMPEITIRGVRVSRLEVLRDTVTAEAEVAVEFRNRNERTALMIGAMEVEAWSGRVGLGRATIEGFPQRPRDATTVTAAVGVRRAAVNLVDVEELEAAENPIVVVLTGHVGFRYGAIQVKGVPVLVSCSAVKSEVDSGNKALCSIRIIPV